MGNPFLTIVASISGIVGAIIVVRKIFEKGFTTKKIILWSFLCLIGISILNVFLIDFLFQYGNFFFLMYIFWVVVSFAITAFLCSVVMGIMKAGKNKKNINNPGEYKSGGSFAKIAIAVLSILVVILGVIVITGRNSNNSNTASDSQSSIPTIGDSSNTIITQAEARRRFRMGYNDAYENYDRKQDLYGSTPLDLILNEDGSSRNMSSSKFYNAGYDAGISDHRRRISSDPYGAWDRSKWALFGFTPSDLID